MPVTETDSIETAKCTKALRPVVAYPAWSKYSSEPISRSTPTKPRLNPAQAAAAPGEHDQRPNLDLGWLI